MTFADGGMMNWDIFGEKLFKWWKIFKGIFMKNKIKKFTEKIKFFKIQEILYYSGKKY